MTYYGEKGTLKLSVWSYDYIPKGNGERVHVKAVEEREEYPEDLQHKETEIFAAPGNRRQLLNFVQARRTQAKLAADIEEGHISSACCILANLSMELGRSLKWDAENGRVVGDEEANRRLVRPYRKGWEHPTVEGV